MTLDYDQVDPYTRACIQPSSLSIPVPVIPLGVHGPSRAFSGEPEFISEPRLYSLCRRCYGIPVKRHAWLFCFSYSSGVSVTEAGLFF